MPHDVFISHSTKDKPAADAICAALEAARVRCWIAPRDVRPGLAFSGEIKRAIERCKVVVLVFSSHSNTSEDVLREVQLAARNHCHIVNFRIENVSINDDLDYYLTVPHWLDALTPPMEHHYSQLVESVKALVSMDHAIAAEPNVLDLGERPGLAKETTTLGTGGIRHGTATPSEAAAEEKIPEQREGSGPPPVPPVWKRLWPTLFD